MVAIGEIVKWQRFCTLNNRGFMILERLLFFSGKSSPPLQSWSLHIVRQFCTETLIVIRPLSLKSKIKMKLLVLIFIGFRARRRVRFTNIISPRGQTGVPHHSTALLAFRWKVHVQNQATGGPLVVHCRYSLKKLSFDNKWVRWENMLKQLLRMKVFRTAVEQSLPKFSKTQRSQLSSTRACTSEENSWSRSPTAWIRGR